MSRPRRSSSRRRSRFSPPYGDAVFNQRQVPLLLSELDRFPADLGGDWVGQAREPSQVGERGLHLYLWFIGD